MKKTALLYIFVLVSLFSMFTSSLFASPGEIFFDDSALPAVDSSIVIRQQRIELDGKELSNTEIKTIHLNLFDDVGIDIVKEKYTPTPDGSFIVEGTIIGQPSSSTLFVINNERITGEISWPGSLFQVRTLDNGIYIAQEIYQTVISNRESKPFLSGVTDDVISLTNDERAKYGLQPLAYNYLLTLSAQGHAADMAQNNYFDHTSLDGSTPSDRITAAGYTWNYAAENIAAGYSTAASVVNGWINSPGHHANMISDTACDIGVGYAYNASSQGKYYWVQNFGREMGVSTCPSIQVGKVPDVVTGAATKIGTTTVQLNGTVNPNGLATTYYFEVGNTTAYGSTSPGYDAGSGSTPLTVLSTPTGLLPQTIYHYRLVAYNGMGVTYGQDVTFTTTTDQKVPIAPMLLLLNQGAK